MGDNPKWLKRQVRARMAEKDIKYTTALREILAEREAEKQDG